MTKFNARRLAGRLPALLAASAFAFTFASLPGCDGVEEGEIDDAEPVMTEEEELEYEKSMQESMGG